MKFSEIIKSERKKRHMTQPEFAELVGLSLHTICNYETGKALPRTREIAGRIADALNLNLTDILGEEAEFELETDEPLDASRTNIPNGTSLSNHAGNPNRAGFSNGATTPNGAGFSSGANIPNGIVFLNGVSVSNKITAPSVATTPSGAGFSNGATAPNGAGLSNGVTTPNGVNARNGLGISNGANIPNGAVFSNGAGSPNHAGNPNGASFSNGVGISNEIVFPTETSIPCPPSSPCDPYDSYGKATAERLLNNVLTLYTDGNLTDDEMDDLLLNFQRTLSATRREKRIYTTKA